MQAITIAQAQKLTSPNPFALITSIDAGGRPNVMALSWWTYVSNHPTTVAICLSQKGYTGSLIAETGEFGLNIVGHALQEAAFQFGCHSGRNMDKAMEYSIPLTPSTHIAPPLVKGSRVAMECRLIQTLPVQDHTLFIAEVVGIYGDAATPGLYAMNGYGKLGTVSAE